MLYQKIFTDEKPYHISVGSLSPFPEHRHADFEMNFCIEGGFDIILDRKKYRVERGCATFIPSMSAHEIPEQIGERCVLTLIVGTTLLKKDFGDFTRLIKDARILDLELCENHKISELFLECADTVRSSEGRDELLLLGNIYKIFSHIRRSLSASEGAGQSERDFKTVENIEKALDLIHYNYREEITIERVAALTGYSKSNFCKIFKKTVGESFHQALNRQRVNNAVGFLTMSNMSISDISDEVGFNETKTFCRVFKSVFGMTPGEYRKRIGK